MPGAMNQEDVVKTLRESGKVDTVEVVGGYIKVFANEDTRITMSPDGEGEEIPGWVPVAVDFADGTVLLAPYDHLLKD